ncbi:MAG: PAS domain-containing protein, partial [Oscillospiraceae bacterium]
MINNNSDLKIRLGELKGKLNCLENKLKETQEALKVSQRRYEIAMRFSEVTIFDYNIKTKKILIQPEDFKGFGAPNALGNSIEEIINSGIIAERSKRDLRDIYRRIDEGAASASTIIYANELDGSERILELKLVSVFDQNGQPAYAVGVRKDITEMIKLHKEKEYGELLTSELTFIYEANVSQDKLIRYDNEWAEEIGLGEIKTLTGILKLMCDKYIDPQYIELFLEKQSPK